jgi:hypothetical protein
LNPKRLPRETKPLTVNDQEFLRSLGWSILALIVSALLLVSAFAVYTANQSPDGAINANNKVILGKELVTRMGSAKIDGDSLNELLACLGVAVFLFFIFYFTNHYLSALDMTTLNRALMYLVPTLIFYVFVHILQPEESNQPGNSSG